MLITDKIEEVPKTRDRSRKIIISEIFDIFKFRGVLADFTQRIPPGKYNPKTGGVLPTFTPRKTPRILFSGGFLEIFLGAEPPEKTPGAPEKNVSRTPRTPPKLSVGHKG